MPVHRQVREWFLDLVDGGVLQVGDRLPAERLLADHVGVSRMTLRRALEGLEQSGRFDRVPGSRGGLRVGRSASVVDISNLVGLRAQLLRSASTAGSRVVTARTIRPGAEVCAALGLNGGLAHEIVRVRLSDDVPVVIERSYFPAKILPGLLEQDLTGSMYDVLHAHYDLAPALATQVVEPVAFGSEDASLLAAEPGGLGLLITRTSSANRGIVVEHSRDVFRSDLLHVVVSGRVPGP